MRNRRKGVPKLLPYVVPLLLEFTLQCVAQTCPNTPKQEGSWPANSTVYYSLDGSLPAGAPAQVLQAISSWNQANQSNNSGVTFVPGPPPSGTSNARTISFSVGNANGRPAEVSQTGIPIMSAHVRFDTSLVVGSPPVLVVNPSAAGYDTVFTKLALHEIGHTMGLAENPQPGGNSCGGQIAGGSVMNGFCGIPNDAANNQPTAVTGCDNGSVSTHENFPPPPPSCSGSLTTQVSQESRTYPNPFPGGSNFCTTTYNVTRYYCNGVFVRADRPVASVQCGITCTLWGYLDSQEPNPTDPVNCSDTYRTYRYQCSNGTSWEPPAELIGTSCIHGGDPGCSPAQNHQGNHCSAWDESGCYCYSYTGTSTPIIIPVGKDAAYRLTSLQDGVEFDINATGTAIRTSWTAPGRQMGFLFLDRNSNGTVDDGSELFGNHTPLPSGETAKQGFEALAVYDQPAHGGNGDGWIDSRDTIWQSLRIWVDTNHDGTSQASEIFTLESVSVSALSVDFKALMKHDAFGNTLRFKAKAIVREQVRWAHDVFFTTGDSYSDSSVRLLKGQTLRATVAAYFSPRSGFCALVAQSP